MATEKRRRPRPGDVEAGEGSAKATPKPGEQLRDSVVERVAEKIGDKLSDTLERKSASVARKVEHLERHAAKAAMTAEALDRIAAHLGALDVWTRVEPTARRPRFTRDEIAAAATRIADAEGFAAVSMRRIAAELDAGTMTLYHYVRTKDELLTLVTDAVMAEVVVPLVEPMPQHWRAALVLIAGRTRDALQRHPWILDIIDDPAIGPNSVRHFDQSLQAVASLPITLGEKLDIVGMVDEYVFGYCLQLRNNAQPEPPGFDDGMVGYVNGLLETGDYPHLRELAADIGIDAMWRQIEDHTRDGSRFGRNLDRLLDGIEASLPPIRA
jgi:AcrR family transcriptional regulator